MVTVLLFPEDFEGVAPVATPVYASVRTPAAANPTVVLLSAPQGTVGRTTRAIARARVVPEGEFAAGAAGELLREAVVGRADGTIVYGQVSAYDMATDTVTIRTGGGLRSCPRDTIAEVAPVVAILMCNSSLRSNDHDEAAVAASSNVILDRLLGQNGEPASRAISRILRGILPARAQPKPTDTVQWTNAMTGVVATVSVRHAVDFAHFVDGGRRIPPSLRDRIGDRFDADPTVQPEPLEDAAAEEELLDEGDESLEALLGVADAHRPPTRRAPALTDEPTLQTQVLAAIAHDPELVRFYLTQCQQQGTKRAATDDLSPPARRVHQGGPSDLLNSLDATDRSRSKHVFRPTRVQQAVYAAIASPDHLGKNPVELMDAMISSRATRFLPHPATLSRVYDLEFGVRGLSIMHFERFDFSARRRWLLEGTINLNNFGPSIELPRAPRAQHLEDLSNALSVLQVFVDEFMDDVTCRLISTAREFIEEIRGYGQWSPHDLETLLFWFDGVLEDYRRAIERDVRGGTRTRVTVREQFSFQDAQFQGVLYAIQSERWAQATPPASTPVPPPPTAHGGRQPNPAPGGGPGQRRADPPMASRIPREVLDALPRQGNKSVCMRFLSKAGCHSRQPGRCTAPASRAHFVPKVIPPVVQQYIVANMGGIRDDLQRSEERRRTRLLSVLQEAHIAIPQSLVAPAATAPTVIDEDLSAALSSLVTSQRLTLGQLVALWRNENPTDGRPNKALDPVWLDILLHGYHHKQAILSAVRDGVTHTFVQPRRPDATPTRNHRSAIQYANALQRSIGEGQHAGTYIVLDTAVVLPWKQLRFSPFGIVPKKDVDPREEGRLIHDLSHPAPHSVNAQSSQDDIPDLVFEPVRRLAERIEALATRYPRCERRMMKGDVKGAFRHIPVAASLAQHFAGSAADQTIVDLALPFGWTGSPAHYGVFGGAIAYLVARESPASLDQAESDNESFFSYVWVDDHVLVEVNTGNRLSLADTALRLAMLAVLGPRAINDKKFSCWETRLQALGLLWDTAKRHVSMPPEKLAKAQSRINEAITGKRVSKLQLAKLLGSLRHVSVCVRSTRAFLQRLHVLWRHAPAHGSLQLPCDVQQDLMWVTTLLQAGSTNAVPTSIIAETLEPVVHLFMDASDLGLCVLYPAAREYLRVRFDSEEQENIARQIESNHHFSINVREALSVAFAAAVWGPQWKRLANTEPIHVRCWIDNASAVAWIRRHRSANAYGQELVRFVSCAEVEFQLHISTAHLSGATNIMADRGSRAWSGRAITIPEDLQAEIAELQWRSLADTSRRQYLSTWRQWTAFCARHGFAKWISADDSFSQSLQLTAFAVSCWSSGNGSTHLRFETIRAKVSHVGWCHQLATGIRPRILPQHELAFSGMQRLSPAPRQRGAVTLAMLHKIHDALNLTLALHRVICGAAVLGFFFCLRGAEFLSTSGRRHAYCLLTTDVEVLDASGNSTASYSRASTVRVTLRGSKTDQQGQSTSRELLKGSRPPVCPVFAALLLLQNAATISHGSPIPLCSINSSAVLSARTMTRTLRWAASQLKADPATISTHSLRVGGASALHEAGASVDTIKTHGRWASDAYQRYIRQPSTRVLNLTARIDKQAATPPRALPPSHHQGAVRAHTLVRAGRR